MAFETPVRGDPAARGDLIDPPAVGPLAPWVGDKVDQDSPAGSKEDLSPVGNPFNPVNETTVLNGKNENLVADGMLNKAPAGLEPGNALEFEADSMEKIALTVTLKDMLDN